MNECCGLKYIVGRVLLIVECGARDILERSGSVAQRVIDIVVAGTIDKCHVVGIEAKRTTHNDHGNSKT